MQIVIDIPEESYNLLKGDGVDWLGAEHILSCVEKGKVLPKGHGDLIDRNALYAGPHFVMSGKTTVGKKDFGIQTFDMFAKRDIDAMKPLIPADKGDAE